MTLPAINPIRAAQPVRSGRIEAGTDEALHQLEAHCETLNQSERRMQSGKQWFVNGEAPRRYVDVRFVGIGRA